MSFLSKRNLTILLALIVFAAIIATSPRSDVKDQDEPVPEDGSEVKIGVTYMVLSEDTQIWPHPIPEEDVLTLIEITEAEINHYAEELNSSMRFQLVPMRITYWEETPPGLTEIRALHEQGVDLVVGHDFSMAMRYSYGYAHANRTLMLSPTATYLGPDPLGEYVFTLRPGTHPTVFAEMLADLGFRRAVVFGTGLSLWTPYLDSVSEKLEYDVRETSIVYDMNAPDTYRFHLGQAAEKVRELLEYHAPEEVCLLFDTMIDIEEMPNMLDVACEFPELSKIRWFDVIGCSEEFIVERGLDGLFAEHGLTQMIGSTSNGTEAHRFTERYKENVGSLPTPSRIYDQAARYDAIWIMAKAVLECGTDDSTAVSERLPEVSEDYMGAIGSCRIEDGARATADYRVYEWRLTGDDAAFVEIGYYDSSSLTFHWYDTENQIG
ncbi:MAG TPA: hypothetical protein VM050_10530 [Patescibacteria group bacterium]|nr:hypothetical protein [Patescibacteria group bacterium]